MKSGRQRAILEIISGPLHMTGSGFLKSLPADVRVNSGASQDEFKLTFTPSIENAVTIDEDGVMTVNKNALKNLGVTEETMTIEMKLEYEGKTFTDELIIYLTELEVETNV